MNTQIVSIRVLTAGVLFCLLSTAVWARPGKNDDPSRPCLHYDGDGCSIPLGLPFFYKRQFTPSCDKHDVCYHCGVAYKIPRPQCDETFRQNTLATCKAIYLTPPTPSSPALNAAYTDTGKAANTSHTAQLLKVVDQHGVEILEKVFRREISDLVKVHPVPTMKQFLEWFSTHEVQVRMLADYTRNLVSYLEQQSRTGSWKMSPTTEPVPDQFLSVRDGQGIGEDTNMVDWCGEVKNYLKAHNETIPPSSGVVCRDINYFTCNFFSKVYYYAVRIFAGIDYRKSPEFYCRESWVPKCLPPSPSTVLKFIPNVFRLGELP